MEKKIILANESSHEESTYLEILGGDKLKKHHVHFPFRHLNIQGRIPWSSGPWACFNSIPLIWNIYLFVGNVQFVSYIYH